MSNRLITVVISSRTIVAVVAAVALAWAFVSVRGVLLTVFLAVFAALVLDPPVRAVQARLGLGRGAATGTVMVGLVVLVLGASAVLIAPLVDAVRALVDALPDLVTRIRDSQIGHWIDERSDIGELAQAHVREIASGVVGAAGGVLGVATTTFGLLFSIVTAVFMTLFLLLDLPRLFGAVDTLLTPAGSERWRRVSGEIVHTISRTMLASLTLGVTCGVTYALAAWALGAPYPVALGVIAGFLDLVPQFGATIAGFIVVLATLTEGLVPAVVMLAIVLTYQQVENQLLQPVVVGRAARVSGFFVLVSVLVFGALFGVVGVVVAVPLTASIQIVVREITAPRREAMAALRRATDALPVDA
ncbi:MAG: AI-2E family transporter, partial [Actinomycetota bacterium]|nr:AI-2E family transporter [Actinomycetota bacterium]